jgi:hypothetical protein
MRQPNPHERPQDSLRANGCLTVPIPAGVSVAISSPDLSLNAPGEHGGVRDGAIGQWPPAVMTAILFVIPPTPGT